jgi:predicted Zn-dependent peptidase
LPEFVEEYEKTNDILSEIEADISVPQLLMGIKLPIYHRKDLVKHDLILGMLVDVLFGRSSDFYQTLLSKELINESFSKEATLNPCHSYILIGGETKYPGLLRDEIKNHLQNASAISISEERFEQMKRRFVGSFVQAFNYIEFIANNFSKYHFLGHSLFEMLELYQDITIDDIYQMSKELEKEEYYASVIMNPSKKSA